MAQNIEINIKNEDGYEVLYPNIVSTNVVDFSGENPLLSDTTRAILGLQSNSTPDDAFQAVQNNTPQVGDIKNTIRNDLGNDWLLCNGAQVNRSDYPELSQYFADNYSDPWKYENITGNFTGTM